MNPEIVIDRHGGAILIGSEERLVPWERKQRVEPRLAAFVHAGQDHGNGYEWLYLNGFSFGGQPAALSLCFAWKRLEMATWSVSLPGAAPGWPGADGVAAEIRFVRRVLADMVGYSVAAEEMRLPWGGVWSGYDPKADIASHGLRYRQ